jgi:hypothetical protein
MACRPANGTLPDNFFQKISRAVRISGIIVGFVLQKA